MQGARILLYSCRYEYQPPRSCHLAPPPILSLQHYPSGACSVAWRLLPILAACRQLLALFAADRVLPTGG